MTIIYVIFLAVLWLVIIALLAAASVVLVALFGGSAALCVACRRLTGLRQRAGDHAKEEKGLESDDKGSA